MLLTSDKAAANFSDRSLLKNLGHWLGMITLAKNKPILYTVRIRILFLFFHHVLDLFFVFDWGDTFSSSSQDLEVKSLLLEAYLKGQQELLYVVPFVAKVLESSLRSMVSKLLIVQTELCQCCCYYVISLPAIVSKKKRNFCVSLILQVFRPQNPWTMAIMNVLAELHQEHDLKVIDGSFFLFSPLTIDHVCKSFHKRVAKKAAVINLLNYVGLHPQTVFRFLD